MSTTLSFVADSATLPAGALFLRIAGRELPSEDYLVEGGPEALADLADEIDGLVASLEIRLGAWSGTLHRVEDPAESDDATTELVRWGHTGWRIVPRG